VQEFVGVAHGNLDRVKELLEASRRWSMPPGIGVAAIWETGLGAAAHMGRPISPNICWHEGARLTSSPRRCSASWEVVASYSRHFPGAHKVRGPHGISLIAHARAGGASAVVEFWNLWSECTFASIGAMIFAARYQKDGRCALFDKLCPGFVMFCKEDDYEMHPVTLSLVGFVFLLVLCPGASQ